VPLIGHVAAEAQLRERLVDAGQPAAPASWDWSQDDCVMMRDPSVPETEPNGHRLFAAEVDAMLAYWDERFFHQPGTVVIYREDAAALNAAMPISVYTDMYHYVRLRRLGLVLWEQVPLEIRGAGDTWRREL
jgi:hypothetical protein